MEDGVEAGLIVVGTGARARVLWFDNFGAIIGSRVGAMVGIGFLCFFVLGVASKIRETFVQKPFTICVCEGNVSGVEHYLALGANPAVPNLEGRTALGEAVMFKHPDVVRVLSAHGANPNDQVPLIFAEDKDPLSGHFRFEKWSVLEAAKKYGDRETVKLLHQAGAAE